MRYHIRVLLSHFLENAVPEDHRIVERICLADTGKCLVLLPRQLVGVPDDSLRSLAGKDAVLDDHLTRLPLVKPRALSGVLSLRVLTDEGHIDLFFLHIFQRALRSLQELNRSQVYILVKIVTYPDQKPPQGDIVRNSRVSDCSQKDRVIFCQNLNTVLRHHLSGLQIILAAPGEIREGKPETSVE